MYNNLCAVKNMITLMLYALKRRIRSVPFLKNEPIFAIIDSINE